MAGLQRPLRPAKELYEIIARCDAGGAGAGMAYFARFIDFASGNAGEPYFGTLFAPDRAIAIPDGYRRAQKYCPCRDNIEHSGILDISAK